MDSYKLEEVKMLIEKNMLTSDILKNILTSSTRRIELYDNSESVDILKFLSKEDCVPDETKEEIKKFLSEYDSSKSVEEDNDKIKEKISNWKVVLLYAVVITLITVSILLYLL